MHYALDLLQVEVDAGVAFARIDAPPMNLLDGPLLASLDALGRQVCEDDEVRVLVLRSANPDFFIAHGDVETIVRAPEGGPAKTVSELGFVHTCLDRLRSMPKVSIAQVEGFARGGGTQGFARAEREQSVYD